jgi:hypothetical protein
MSAALKRRLNFETVMPIADAGQEVQLVSRRAAAVLSESETTAKIDEKLLELLVTSFRDLREGRAEEGWNVERPAAVMSTAEAVTVAAAITRQGAFFASHGEAEHVVALIDLTAMIRGDLQYADHGETTDGYDLASLQPALKSRLVRLRRTGSPRMQGAAWGGLAMLAAIDSEAFAPVLASWWDGATTTEGRKKLRSRLNGLVVPLFAKLSGIRRGRWSCS